MYARKDFPVWRHHFKLKRGPKSANIRASVRHTVSVTVPMQKFRFRSRLEGTARYNAKPQEATEPLDRLGPADVFCVVLWPGVDGSNPLPKLVVVGSNPIARSK